MKDDQRAQADDTGLQAVLIHHNGVLNEIFQFVDACLVLGLCRAGCIILRILGKVAEALGNGDVLPDLLSVLCLSALQLGDKLLVAALGILLFGIFSHDLFSFVLMDSYIP